MAGFSPDRYDSMNYRRCGRSGLKLPAVSLGLWQSLGDTGNEATCREVMYRAFDGGITHFDLANNYGNPGGNSELVAGRILVDMPRDELIISTKAGYGMWPGPYGDFGSKKYLVASLDQSLLRMGLDYVDIFYHHRPDPDTPLDETMGALDLIVKQGKALYAGVSNYQGELLGEAAGLMSDRGWAPLTINQPSYSMINRRIERDTLAVAEESGVGVIAFCPLSSGVLTDRYLDGLPADSRQGLRGDSGQSWYEEREKNGLWDGIRKLRGIAQERGQTMAQMALTWILRDDRVTSVLIGASRVEQIDENLAAGNATPLTSDEIDNIEAILAEID
ncbi:L-glyceraldehyde 3-phosphate reductase [Candidatus Poribacteria bacterium]|jgi:L-glyceraldehyde 3-phosphate reductase|nr:L-glyceraldehyde 3-phosphate reductase [Candidatus Poribacteria bacterium]MBT5531840.1 L-glyceraldehyde 3-phosphate reductase [Candidatus Poribacteria bacterium]MBT5712703.1 L-glyceraldehyde 3-phosphate reductase [Candidatus Poribacteria bacterium]MBT7806094.1 L-glyceraldehyde 3-phosphate reductase [Candidatus Poribacteria bacterium]